MNPLNRKSLIYILIVLIVAWIVGSKKYVIPVNPYPPETPEPNPVTQLVPLTIGDTAIQTEVRRTDAEQALGLSWRHSLEANQAMTFIYPSPQKVLFWMKGMQFPLDFIWVRQGKVIELIENVAAPTSENPVVQTVVPKTEVDTVIEVNAGFIKQHGIQVGDDIELN